MRASRSPPRPLTSQASTRGSRARGSTTADEYDGNTLSDATERESVEPLNLGELDEFFSGAWPFLQVLEMNFETDTDQMLNFFQGVSQFYPDFDRLLRERVIAAYPEPDDDP
ncbi:MAG: hypothetical protein NVS4B6_20060 [Mycobacterium sp.]